MSSFLIFNLEASAYEVISEDGEINGIEALLGAYRYVFLTSFICVMLMVVFRPF